ncbi:MAG: hypothetical protein Q8P58_00805 [Candidatus Adlerbacteria bacterium]|nr:hypothetical protein [Candidatus Adlerbacteria bacterium]MDZ4225899.1 hypothetical protein [Patescibacteria group bacterium]
MSKETAIIALGFWVMVMPYLGIPRTWLTILMILTALGLMVLGFFLRAEALSRGPRPVSRHNPFVEHIPHSEQETHQESHERKERINSLN